MCLSSFFPCRTRRLRPGVFRWQCARARGSAPADDVPAVTDRTWTSPGVLVDTIDIVRVRTVTVVDILRGVPLCSFLASSAASGTTSFGSLLGLAEGSFLCISDSSVYFLHSSTWTSYAPFYAPSLVLSHTSSRVMAIVFTGTFLTLSVWRRVFRCVLSRYSEVFFDPYGQSLSSPVTISCVTFVSLCFSFVLLTDSSASFGDTELLSGHLHS